MRAVVFNGALEDDDSLAKVYHFLLRDLTELNFETTGFVLRNMGIAICRGCFGCWIKTPGVCVQDDAGRDTARAFARSDLIVYLTPIVFGGYSSQLKKAVDRIIPNVLPFLKKTEGEVYHLPRYKKKKSLIGLGLLPRSYDGSEAIFRTLIKQNSFNAHCHYYDALVFTEEENIDNILGEFRETLKQGGICR